MEGLPSTGLRHLFLYKDGKNKKMTTTTAKTTMKKTTNITIKQPKKTHKDNKI